MSDQDPPPQPEPPAELWMLWSPKYGGCWAGRPDDEPGQQSFMVMLTEAHALLSAEILNSEYDIECYPVRVK